MRLLAALLLRRLSHLADCERRAGDDGVGTMKLGERATINIPWEHAYGAAGHPGFKIPGKADLRFEIEVLKIG